MESFGLLLFTLILTLGICSAPFSSTTSKVIVTRFSRSTVCFASFNFGSMSERERES